MAATLYFFMLPDDERALFRILERHHITLYPELFEPGWKAPRADAAALPALDQSTYYLALEELGPVVFHPVKRGPDKGLLKIEEIPSPVFHYERSLPNEAGELVGGRLWAELIVTGATEDMRGKPRGLTRIFDEIHDWFRKGWRRSDPKGYWVGPKAAEAWKHGALTLREPGHKGRTYGVWR
jgi:hypothetical protein